MISLYNITKRYRSKYIFDKASISFDYRINLLLGANGVGKTTLINILAGLVKPESGYWSFNQQKISYSDGSYRRRIGFLMDLPNFPYHLNIKEYIELLNAIYKLNSNDHEKELMDFFELNDYKDSKLKDLSTGFLKRVKLLASMLHDPEVFIYDEPFSGLDQAFVPKLVEKIEALNGHKKGFIITSHSEKINLFNSAQVVRFEVSNKRLIKL